MKTSIVLRVSALLSVIFSSMVLHDSVFAAGKKRKPTQAEPSPVHVIVLDPNIDTKKINKEAIVHDQSNPSSQIIDSFEREELWNWTVKSFEEYQKTLAADKAAKATAAEQNQ